jgi:ribosomal protein L31E
MSSTTAKIVQGINQAAANAYDGSHDERYTHDGKARAMGLKREEGDPILDSRVIDGFKVKFSGDAMCINYQSEVKLKEVYAGGFEDEMARRINEIKKFLQKEYKAITGKSVRITPMKDEEIHVMVQSASRVHSWVQAHQWFKISGMESEPILSPSEDRVDKAIRDFLSLKSDKRPNNDTRK